MTLAKIQATQKLYQSLTGTKHVHLKGRRVSPPRALAPLPLPAHCALPNPAPTHARAGHGHHHSAHAPGVAAALRVRGNGCFESKTLRLRRCRALHGAPLTPRRRHYAAPT
jgi:hypothetical protein